MAMLTGRPDFLRHQLRLCESLLKPLHAVIDLLHSLAHTTEPGFLAGLLRYPLRKLRFTGAHFMIEPLRFRRASLRITRQCIDPLGQDLPTHAGVRLHLSAVRAPAFQRHAATP